MWICCDVLNNPVLRCRKVLEDWPLQRLQVPTLQDCENLKFLIFFCSVWANSFPVDWSVLLGARSFTHPGMASAWPPSTLTWTSMLRSPDLQCSSFKIWKAIGTLFSLTALHFVRSNHNLNTEHPKSGFIWMPNKSALVKGCLIFYLCDNGCIKQLSSNGLP